jgi:hypothetical protein
VPVDARVRSCERGAGDCGTLPAVTIRTLMAAVVALAVGWGSIGAADAQLWKPKKKTVISTVTKKKPVVRKRKPVRKPVNSVVKFKPPPRDDDDTVASSDDSDRNARDNGDRGDGRDEVDDRPRITVVDGDRD